MDVFCGSGAVGLEALSRGAVSAVLVDGDAAVLRVTKKNQARLAAAAGVIRRIDLPGGLSRARGLSDFDLIFADPPYSFADWGGLLSALEDRIGEDGEIAIEHAASASLPMRVGRLFRASSRRYGHSCLSFFVCQEEGSRRKEASSR